jgi:hypothetical protein
VREYAARSSHFPAADRRRLPLERASEALEIIDCRRAAGKVVHEVR